MKLATSQYRFTVADIETIVDFGYEIVMASSISLDALINQEFANLDMVSILATLEESFSPTTGLKITRKLICSHNPSSLHIHYCNEYSRDDEALVFDRRFWKKQSEIFIDHNMCVLPREFQGKGILKKIFQKCLQQYFNIGLKKIYVYAGLEGGGHVWARHGFVAIFKDEVEFILEEARTFLIPSEFKAVEHIFTTYYTRNPNGRSFPIVLWAMLDSMKPILRGSHWHGELNLDDSGQLRNFISYVFRE